MIDPPVTSDFLADVDEEATYQRHRWGETHDADKDDSFWFWTLGHIVGKAIHDPDQTVEKQRHRLRAGAALLLNWDRHIAAREGIETDALMRMDRPVQQSTDLTCSNCGRTLKYHSIFHDEPTPEQIEGLVEAHFAAFEINGAYCLAFDDTEAER